MPLLPQNMKKIKKCANKVKCVTCKTVFTSHEQLEQHGVNPPVTCKKLNCVKCGKEFNHKGDYNRHQRRKTPCQPIAGDPTKAAPKNACMFCYRQLSTIQALRRHFTTCTVKNGGIATLREEIIKLKKENLELKEKQGVTVNAGGNAIIGNNNTVNHHNTNINFNIIGFGTSEAHTAMLKVIQQKALDIIKRPQLKDVPYVDQVNKRVCELVELVHRNPEHKELQNLYVTSTHGVDNVLVYEDGGWVIGNWDDKNKEMLQSLYMGLKKAKIGSKQDTLQTIKQIFVLGGCGSSDLIREIPDDDVERLYMEIGEKLGFDTIHL